MNPTGHGLINSIQIWGKMNKGTAGGEICWIGRFGVLLLADLNPLLSITLSSPVARAHARCSADGGLGGGGHCSLLARRQSPAVWMGFDAIVVGGSRYSRS
ncbi:hypothetical protein ACLOJK_024190 [Asimina triloba]